MKGLVCLFDYGIIKIWVVVRFQFCVDGVISCPVRRPIDDDQYVSKMLSQAFSRISGSSMIRGIVTRKELDCPIAHVSFGPFVSAHQFMMQQLVVLQCEQGKTHCMSILDWAVAGLLSMSALLHVGKE